MKTTTMWRPVCAMYVVHDDGDDEELDADDYREAWSCSRALEALESAPKRKRQKATPALPETSVDSDDDEDSLPLAQLLLQAAPNKDTTAPPPLRCGCFQGSTFRLGRR